MRGDASFRHSSTRTLWFQGTGARVRVVELSTTELSMLILHRYYFTISLCLPTIINQSIPSQPSRESSRARDAFDAQTD
jgi:hypothetical protein